MCVESWYTTGWNYVSNALDDNQTTGAIADCASLSVAVGLTGAGFAKLTLTVLLLSLFIGSTAAIGVAWYQILKNSLDSKQIQADGCGVVLDINKFTYFMTPYMELIRKIE